MKSRRTPAPAHWLLGLLSATFLGGAALAQPTPAPAPSDGAQGGPWNLQVNRAARQADAWFANYRFRDGEMLPRLKIHYATLGSPHRNAKGEIDNAVLVLYALADGSSTVSLNTAPPDTSAGGRPAAARRTDGAGRCGDCRRVCERGPRHGDPGAHRLGGGRR